jgi:glycosyltransferase involved in cell wall biosynthesis
MFVLNIEGWRFFPQSFSIINQFQCLELLKRNDIQLFHTDAALPPPGFLRVGQWKADAHLFDAACIAALRSIPPLPTNKKPDATLRIAIPYNFSAAPHGRTFVFSVTEGRRLNVGMIAGRQTLASALRGRNEITIVTPSEWSKAGLVASGATPSQVAVVPHGVDTRIFSPIDDLARDRLRAARNWNSDSFVFLHVGALYSWKGTALLLKVFAAVAARYPHVRLALKGTDAIYASRSSVAEMRQKLTAAERSAIAGRIDYIGNTLSYSELADLYRSADILVSPYHLEGFNLPVLEAIACGLPVICTGGGPTDDFTRDEFSWRIDSKIDPVDDGQAVRLTPDPDHLTALMENAIEDNGFRARALASGPAFAAANYSWVRAVDRLVEVLTANR